MIGREISTGLKDYHFRIRSATDTNVGVVSLQKDQAGRVGGGYLYQM